MVLRHSTERPYPCLKCDKQFKTSGSLKAHQAVHSAVRPFTCEFCQETFKYKGTMTTHVKKSCARAVLSQRSELCSTVQNSFSCFSNHETGFDWSAFFVESFQAGQKVVRYNQPYRSYGISREFTRLQWLQCQSFYVTFRHVEKISVDCDLSMKYWFAVFAWPNLKSSSLLSRPTNPFDRKTVSFVVPSSRVCVSHTYPLSPLRSIRQC